MNLVEAVIAGKLCCGASEGGGKLGCHRGIFSISTSEQRCHWGKRRSRCEKGFVEKQEKGEEVGIEEESVK